MNIQKEIKKVDASSVVKAFKKMDESFSTLSENQVYIQQNQVEFESYLRDIQQHMSEVLVELGSIHTTLLRLEK